MLLDLAREILELFPDTNRLLQTLSAIAGREPSELDVEIREHLAARIAFVLVGEVEGAANYAIIRRRIEHALGMTGADASRVIDIVARTLVTIDSADTGKAASLSDLPYPFRRELMARQGNRCGICGLMFSGADVSGRTEVERIPALDHRIPRRLGGDGAENLWILCGLCNSIKEATVHIGEHGRIWTNNHVYLERSRAVAFWVMRRDSRCRHSGCLHVPTTSRMHVARHRSRGAWVVDNCLAYCTMHALSSECMDY